MSNIQIPKTERPPFIRFETREHGINNEASERAGRPVPGVVTMVLVTSPGSKDEFCAVAEEWLKQKRNQAIQGTYNPDWVDQFEKQFAAWQKGEDLPREGTPVKTWPAVKTEQRIRLHALGYTTIEDLATVPDSGLSQIGLDGRYLRDLARTWINESKEKGVSARAVADAQVTIEQQAQQIESLRERLAAMESQMMALRGQQPAADPETGLPSGGAPRRTGRPRNIDNAQPLG